MNRKNQLYFFGMLLFLLGLLAGFGVPAFKNPRMGVAAHLEGVMNGGFLIAVGLIWQQFQLTEKIKTFAYWFLLWGSYANFIACVIAAAIGASRMTPIAGAGFTAEPWQENFVAALFASVGVTMVLAVGALAWGLKKAAFTDLRPE